MSVGGVQLWGVVNVTPDSFSDGGAHLRAEDACRAALGLVEAGADVVDVGGESSRPAGGTYGDGFAVVSEREELCRVLPVVRALVERGVRVSIDTSKPAVARDALAAGARIVNDVSCVRDPDVPREAARASADYVVMHRRGLGEVPPDGGESAEAIVEAVLEELRAAVARAEHAGVAREHIWVDPGIGFSKPARHSMVLLGRLAAFGALGLRVLVGPSRKSFIRHVHDAPPSRRLGGTVAACLAAADAGAAALRVHEVEPVVQALLVARAIREAGAPEGAS